MDSPRPHPSAQLLLETFGAQYAPNGVAAYERWWREQHERRPSGFERDRRFKRNVGIVVATTIALLLLLLLLLLGRAPPKKCALPCGNSNEVSPCAVAGTVAGIAYGFRMDIVPALSLAWLPPYDPPKLWSALETSRVPSLHDELLDGRQCATIAPEARSAYEELRGFRPSLASEARNRIDRAQNDLDLLQSEWRWQLTLYGRHGRWYRACGPHRSWLQRAGCMFSTEPQAGLRTLQDLRVLYLDVTKRAMLALDQLFDLAGPSAEIMRRAQDTQASVNSTIYALATIVERDAKATNSTCVVEDVLYLHNVIAHALLLEAATFALSHVLRALDVFISPFHHSRILTHAAQLDRLDFKVDDHVYYDNNSYMHPGPLVVGTIVRSTIRRAVYIAAQKWSRERFGNCYRNIGRQNITTQPPCRLETNPVLAQFFRPLADGEPQYGPVLLRGDAPRWPNILFVDQPIRCLTLGRVLGEQSVLRALVPGRDARGLGVDEEAMEEEEEIRRLERLEYCFGDDDDDDDDDGDNGWREEEEGSENIWDLLEKSIRDGG